MVSARTHRRHAATALGLACVAASGFLIACSDDDGGADDSRAGAGGSSGRASAGGAGRAGGSSVAGASAAGAASAGQPADAGFGGQAGETNEDGAAGSEAAGAGTGGSAGTGGTAGMAGMSGSAGSGGAPPTASPQCVRDTVSGKRVEISLTGNDGLFAVAYAPDGDLYAAGYVQDGTLASADRATVVVKLTTEGTLDTSWGNGGIVKVNVVATDTANGISGQGELPRGLAFQGNKILVAGTVEASATAAAPLGNDRNVYVLRLLPDGTLDTTFGDDQSGIRLLPLNTGVLAVNGTSTALVGADQQWGLNVLPDKKILITAATRAEGLQADGQTPRADSDFAVVRLLENGAQDASFGPSGSGVFTLDIANANASVRTASVLPDGKSIITGYASYGGSQRPVIFKLLANGTLDMSFGTLGVFSEPVGSAGEAYGAMLQSSGKLVTVGYGRATAANTSSDLLSIRLTAAGVLDTTYGAKATPGRVWFDVAGLGDNGRAMVLSDDRPVLIGGGSSSAGEQDAVVTLLSVDGQPGSTTFGSPYGCVAYDFGSVGDFFWAGAVSPQGQLAAVGITGHVAGSASDTDGTFVLIDKP